MGILLEIGLALLIVGMVINSLVSGRRNAQRESITERRVDAYMTTIRRERTNPELSAMSDAELRDLLLSSAHNLRQQSQRRMTLLVGGCLLALVAAIMVATQEGTRGFGIALLIGAMVLYGINEYLGRRMREPLLQKGIDIERLRVE